MSAPARQHGQHRARRQSGAALLITLILLLVLTLLGVSSMQSTTMQERMSGNTRDREVAFQAAEAALRAAESWLEAQAVPPQSGTAAYVYGEADPDQDPQWEQVDWSDDSAVGTLAIDGTYDEARYIIEEMDALQSSSGVTQPGTVQQSKHMYRVTARGTGLSPDALVMLQSTYKYGEE